MRTTFWLLLLANVIVFALIWQGGLRWAEEFLAGSPSESALQTQPALHEEKIRLLEMPQSAPVTTFPILAPALPVVTHPFSSNMQLSTTISSPAVVKTLGPACMEWGDFSGGDLKLATAALSALQLGNKLSNRQVDQIIRYWVYIPPLASKAAVYQKIEQLKVRGVGEYFVVQDAGPWRNAISLGIFKTQEAAQNYLNVLRTKGVRSARVGERAGKQKAVIFILNGVSPATEARLTSMQKEFPGSELKNISCPH